MIGEFADLGGITGNPSEEVESLPMNYEFVPAKWAQRRIAVLILQIKIVSFRTGQTGLCLARSRSGLRRNAGNFAINSLEPITNSYYRLIFNKRLDC